VALGGPPKFIEIMKAVRDDAAKLKTRQAPAAQVSANSLVTWRHSGESRNPEKAKVLLL
jgi:hypothetical protein